jgi:deazaflavin-dependent oxidoreductase (nitroreductase family)
MPEFDDFNAKVIEEFRANGGKVGPPFEGANVLLLHTVGAKTGQPRTNPLVYRPDGDRLIIFASYAGNPRHPAWYRNLVAQPKVRVEVGTDTRDVTARVAEGEERTRIWSAQKADVPAFAEYETKTDRQIPVIILEPA